MGDGCRSAFVLVFDELPLAVQTAAGWESYLMRLDPYLRGEQLTEANARGWWAESHELYAERFRVDPEPGRKFAEALRSAESCDCKFGPCLAPAR